MIQDLISVIPVAVAKAAIKSGVARKKIENFNLYSEQLKQRLDPSVTILQGINSKKKIKKLLYLQMEKTKIHLKLQSRLKIVVLELL